MRFERTPSLKNSLYFVCFFFVCYFLISPSVALPKPHGVPSPTKIPLFGRIKFTGYEDDRLSEDWYARVALFYDGSGKTTDAINSKKELYCYKVEATNGVHVRAGGVYKWFGETHNSYSFASNVYSQPVELITLSNIDSNKIKAMSESQRIKTLDRQALLAEALGAVDIFHFNLAVLEQSDRNLMAELQKYAVDSTVQRLFAKNYMSEHALFSDIIAINHSENIASDGQEILLAAKNSTTFPGIAAEAIHALVILENTGKLKTVTRDDFSSFLRHIFDKSGNLLFRPSCVALASIGNDKDKMNIVAGLTSPDRERRIGCLIAVNKSKLPGGLKIVSQLLEEQSDATETNLVRDILRSTSEQTPIESSLQLPRYLMRNGKAEPGFKLKIESKSQTDSITRLIPSRATSFNGVSVLQIDYPNNQTFGIFQLTLDTSRVDDFYNYKQLVVRMRSLAASKRTIKIGIKGKSDPDDQTPSQVPFSNISSDFSNYIVPLNKLDDEQHQRLHTVTIACEIAFGGIDAQVFQIEEIYYQ